MRQAFADQYGTDVAPGRFQRPTRPPIVTSRRSFRPWSTSARHQGEVAPAGDDKLAQTKRRFGSQIPLGFTAREVPWQPPPDLLCTPLITFSNNCVSFNRLRHAIFHSSKHRERRRLTFGRLNFCNVVHFIRCRPPCGRYFIRMTRLRSTQLD